MFNFTKQDIINQVTSRLKRVEKEAENVISDMGYWDNLREQELLKAELKYLNDTASPT